ncbi:MAG: DUF4349 domain-containing protein [Parcubacteria group bacterium]|nr:DUF4349 domain-containing protein [Parcubacteria group bacterium]
MNDEIVQKFKKALSIAFLAVMGIILSVVALSLFFALAPERQSSSVVTDSYGIQPASPSFDSTGVAGVPSDGVNIALPDGGISKEEDMMNVYEEEVIPSQVPESADERKLIQNGALSLVVGRVEDSITLLNGIAANLGGRIDAVSMYNVSGAEKKRATVTLRVPAVNFGSAMEEVKKIARKVRSENISTQDITEKFIDMQARLKNLRAEETQYQEIMQKASKIEDVLQVSERLYFVRQQIEQLQGQMNYLSRQVDMSIITVELSSEPEVNPTNLVWNPLTTAKEAVQALFEGISGLFSIIIFLILFLIPIVILWGAVAVLSVWVIWKILLWLKRRVHHL